MGSLEDLRSEFAAMRELQELAKARMSAAHTAMVSDLQALHDHPNTPEHVRAAIAPILAKHAPKPAKAPRVPKPHHEAVVDEHHQRLTQHPVGTPGHGPALDALRADRRVRQPEMAELARRLGHRAAPSTGRGEAYSRIRTQHEFYLDAAAKTAARRGRTLG